MITFSPAFLDELRNRIRPSEVVRPHVRLHNKAGGEFSGLCPFHQEKTPSFTVSDDKGFYHCFGCGAHGDVIKFVMEVEGLRYPEAITKLAEKAGMELPKEESYSRKSNTDDGKPSLHDVMEKACQWFQHQLMTSGGFNAREYIKSRSLNKDDAVLFRLGFAPDTRNGIAEALKPFGMTQHMLLTAGLLVKNDRGDVYDRFRNRIIFPITDYRGKVIAFGGRIMGEGQPKYLNSPETPIFKKGEILYTSPLTRKAAYDNQHIIVTEGYMDVIALHKAGIDYAAAPLGTAVTPTHLQHLWRLAPEPTLCLDGDSAGQRAMSRVVDLALPLLTPGYSLNFTVLPQGMDPDDVIKQQGKEAIADYIAKAIPLSEALWNIEYSSHPTNTPEQLAGLEKRLEERTRAIQNSSVQYNYHDFFKKKLWNLRRERSQRPAYNNSNHRSSALSSFASTPSTLENPYETLLLATILSHPTLLNNQDIAEDFMHLELHTSGYAALQDAIIDSLHEAEEEAITLTQETLQHTLEKKGFAHHINTIKNNQNVQISLSGFDTLQEQDFIEIWKRFMSLYNLMHMEQEHKTAIENMAQNMTNEAYEKVNALQKQIEDLKKVLDIQ